MRGKRATQSFGSALLLLALLAAENLSSPDGAPHVITLWLLEAGFALFVARVLLALRPLGPWLAARGAWIRWVPTLALAGLLLMAPFSAAGVAVAALLFFGGFLSAEFFHDLASRAAAHGRAVRRPLRFGGFLVAATAVAGLAHYILARAAFQVWGDAPVASAFGAATMGLHAAALVVLLLFVAALLGKGRERMPSRALYALGLLYPLGAFVGYATEDALGTRGAANLPLLAIGVALVEFFDILFAASERVAGDERVLPREALWDLFLAVAFGVLLVLTITQIARQSVSETLFGMKALAWVGLVGGSLLVPISRWRARVRAATA